MGIEEETATASLYIFLFEKANKVAHKKIKIKIFFCKTKIKIIKNRKKIFHFLR